MILCYQKMLQKCCKCNKSVALYIHATELWYAKFVNQMSQTLNKSTIRALYSAIEFAIGERFIQFLDK